MKRRALFWLLSIAAAGCSPGSDSNDANLGPKPSIGSAKLAANVEVRIMASSWGGKSSPNQITWLGNVVVINRGRVPVSGLRIRVTIGFPSGKGPVSQEVEMPSFQSCGNYTRDVLLPTFKSRPTKVRLDFPIDVWRRDTQPKAVCISADEYDYRSGLSDPEKLKAFIFCEDRATVLRAFDDDPSLLKVRSRNEFTPLMMALVQHDVELAKGIEKRGGGRLSDKSLQGVGPYHCASLGSPEMVAFLRSRGVKPSLTTESSRSSLDYAVEMGNFGTLKALLNAGVSPNTKNRDGRTPLLNAIVDHQPEMVKAMKAAGGRFDIFDNNGVAAMGTAIRMVSTAMREPILAMGGNVHEKDQKTGRTLLHQAVLTGGMDDAEWLVRHGVDMNIRDKAGKRPVDYVESLYKHEGDRQLWLDYFARAAKDKNARFVTWR